jgi:ubiquinone/menaquinone biosynthesis C-methylase UbiE
MKLTPAKTNEQQAAAAFSKQSVIFDALYSGNTIIQYKRKRVRDHVSQFLAPNSTILELNSGTGEDAIWFAQQGHRVHATDISTGMQNVMVEKIQKAGLANNISYELCSFTELDQLKHKGPYDLVFSNFAGLNCTGELDKVLHSLTALLKPGGMATLVVLPPFCLWEALLALKGQFKTAFRRSFSSKGVTAHLEGKHFTCWYYRPSYITSQAKSQFDVYGFEGLCTIVPPSYLEHFPQKRPSLYRFLMTQENRLKSTWPWKYMGDYYIISLRKKG